MNRVPLARRVQIINCLVEGNSIRSTERMTGTHRDTICRSIWSQAPPGHRAMILRSEFHGHGNPDCRDHR